MGDGSTYVNSFKSSRRTIDSISKVVIPALVRASLSELRSQANPPPVAGLRGLIPSMRGTAMFSGSTTVRGVDDVREAIVVYVYVDIVDVGLNNHR